MKPNPKKKNPSLRLLLKKNLKEKLSALPTTLSTR